MNRSIVAIFCIQFLFGTGLPAMLRGTSRNIKSNEEGKNETKLDNSAVVADRNHVETFQVAQPKDEKIILKRNTTVPDELSEEITQQLVTSAAQRGDVDILRATMEINPSMFLRIDENGWSLLHEAVRSGNLEAIHVLKNAGLDFHHRNVHDQTALDLAKRLHPNNKELIDLLDRVTNDVRRMAAHGRLDALKNVIESDGRAMKRLTQQDENKWNALHEAARSGVTEVLELIKNNHAMAVDIHAQTRQGHTALNIAKAYHPENYHLHNLLETWSD